MEKMKPGLSQGELMKKRVLNDVELLKTGANYREDGSLEVTQEQIDNAEKEMIAYDKQVEKKEFYEWDEYQKTQQENLYRHLVSLQRLQENIIKELNNETPNLEIVKKKVYAVDTLIKDLMTLINNITYAPYHFSGNEKAGKEYLDQLDKKIKQWFVAKEQLISENFDPYEYPVGSADDEELGKVYSLL